MSPSSWENGWKGQNGNTCRRRRAGSSWRCSRDALLQEEMQGLGTISFDTVKIPSGGGLAFEIAGDDPDNPDVVKELVGVIVAHVPTNVYFASEYDGANDLPDCASADGVYG